MLNENLLKKLIGEEPLDAAEHLALEQALEAGDNSFVAEYLKSSEGPDPSMAWRSSLNEKLRQIAPKPKRHVWKWVGLGGLVSALAVACAAIVFLNSPKPVSVDNGTMAVNTPDTQPDSVDGGSELGRALATAHQSDAAQITVGVRSPRPFVRSIAVGRLDTRDW